MPSAKVPYWRRAGESKVIKNLHEAMIKCGIKDGMTISFHHHLRNGDYVANMIIEEL